MKPTKAFKACTTKSPIYPETFTPADDLDAETEVLALHMGALSEADAKKVSARLKKQATATKKPAETKAEKAAPENKTS